MMVLVRDDSQERCKYKRRDPKREDLRIRKVKLQKTPREI
jgi:hypothetical protein